MTRYRFAIVLFSIFLLCLFSPVYCLLSTVYSANNAFAQEAPAGQTLLEEGINLFKAERFKEAIEVLKEFSLQSPDNHLPYYYIGFSYFRLGDKASAKEALERSIGLKPDFAPAHLGLGVIYEGEGRLDLAKKEYEAIIATGKEEGDLKIARDRLKRTNAVLSTRHIQEAKRLADEEKIEDAINELSLAMDLTPENIAIQMTLGSLYTNQRKFKEAIEVYRKVKELAPANPEVHMRLAGLYYSMSAFKEAVEAFNEVIKLAPGTETALEASKKIEEAEERLGTRGYFEEAAKAIREDRLDDALTATQKVLETEPGNSFAYFNLGVIYNRKKMYPDAEAALRKAVEISPNYVEAFYQLGVVYDDQGKLEEAIIEYEAAAAIGKEEVEETQKARGRLKLLKEVVTTKEVGERARILMEGGDLEGALREAEKIVGLTENEKNLLILGQVYLLKKEFDRAIETFNRVIKINPQSWQAHLFMGRAYEGKKLLREAKSFYSKVAGAAPDTEAGREAKLKLNQVQVKIHFENAGGYKKKGDVEGALQEIQSVLALTPDDPVALYNAGVLYHMLEMPEKAIPPLTKAIEKAPDYLQAHLQLAVVYEYLRRYGEAEAEFKAVLATAKEGKEADIARSRLGLLKKEEAFSTRMRAVMDLIDKGKYEEALDEAKATITIAPENYIAHYTVGFIYERLNMLEEAKTALQKAIEVNPGYARAHFGLARVYEREGLYEDARESYRNTISAGEGTREADMALISLERLKKWRVLPSLNHNMNNVVSLDGTKSIATATGYGLSFYRDIYRTKGKGLNVNSMVTQNLYYESQMTARGYGAGISWNETLKNNQTYRVNAAYLNYTFDNEPNYENYRYSLNATLRPDTIPTSLSLGFDYSDTVSFVSKLRDTFQYTLSFSATQKTSEWTSVSGGYNFVSYINKEPVASNFAYRSNNFSIRYATGLWSGFSAGCGYQFRLVNYMNPDSTTLFTRFRRNVFQGISADTSYRLADKGSVSLSGDVGRETTNIPSLKVEELVELEEKLSNPIPRAGGWDKNEAINLAIDIHYQLSEKVDMSLRLDHTWASTVPEVAGSYRRFGFGISLNTLF